MRHTYLSVIIYPGLVGHPQLVVKPTFGITFPPRSIISSTDGFNTSRFLVSE